MTKMDKKIEEKFHSPYDSSQKNHVESNFWTETPLGEFGFKCIANKHELCNDLKCKCLCH